MLARNELAEYLAEHYGTCDRDRPERNDCYWGVDAKGQRNGCLFAGWRGRECPHWRPTNAMTWEEMIATERVFRCELPSKAR